MLRHIRLLFETSCFATDHGGGKRLLIAVGRGRGGFRNQFGRAKSVLLTDPTPPILK